MRLIWTNDPFTLDFTIRPYMGTSIGFITRGLLYWIVWVSKIWTWKLKVTIGPRGFTVSAGISTVLPAYRIIEPLFPGSESTDQSNTNILLVAYCLFQCNSESVTVGFQRINKIWSYKILLYWYTNHSQTSLGAILDELFPYSIPYKTHRACNWQIVWINRCHRWSHLQI